MAAARYDLTGRRAIEAGATWGLTLVYANDDGTAIDLTGYTARMQVRPAVNANAAIISLTTENDRIAITAATGTISLALSATETAALTLGKGVYDLELVSGATVTRLLEGAVEVKPEVTR